MPQSLSAGLRISRRLPQVAHLYFSSLSSNAKECYDLDENGVYVKAVWLLQLERYDGYSVSPMHLEIKASICPAKIRVEVNDDDASDDDDIIRIRFTLNDCTTNPVRSYICNAISL